MNGRVRVAAVAGVWDVGLGEAPISLFSFSREKTVDSFSVTPQTGPQRRAICILSTAMIREATMWASRSYFYVRRPCPLPKIISQWHRRRPYSIQSQEEAIARLPDINPGALSITRTTTPKQILPPEELIFGRTFTGKHATAFPNSKPYFVLRQMNIQIICSQ